MNNTADVRRAMVNGQVRVNDVTDYRIQNAMLAVERESFVPKSQRAAAYSDIDVPVAEGRFLLKPRDLAKMLQALAVSPSDLVLDIATATGYSATVLSMLAETVVVLEENVELAEKAEKAIELADADNVAVIKGKFCVGLPDQGPFNAIFVGAAVEKTPQAWLKQLADGGRLVVIERSGVSGHVVLYTRSGGIIGSRVIFDALAPYLPGFEPTREFEF
ncbi:MAG: protein-L-isoaspartate O-methyltransferase [Robiginitomaculum sp.]|nr:protein-L-isoaspartate O-methyltransferase [Robiginitomaculum sp.]